MTGGALIRSWLVGGALLALLGEGARAQDAPRGDGPAYLAYAGPYSASPSSAFGHLFLILADAPDTPIPLWDVVTFAAVTFDTDPVRYVTVGILGGFLGRYSRLPFHQKSREYQLLDDRDLWLVELRLSVEQRRALEAALERTNGQWYPYTFFSRNCAWYLQALLAEATSAVDAPGGVVTPAGVMTAVQRTPLAGRSFVRPAASFRIADLAASASSQTVERLEGNGWRAAVADTAWSATLSPDDRDLVQEVVRLRSAESSVALEDATRDGIAQLRLQVAARTPAGAEISGPGREMPLPSFHPYQRVRVGYVSSPSTPSRISVQLRGAMHDELDPWPAHRPLSTMELLSVEVSSPTARVAPRLESAVLFSQRSLVPSTWIRNRRSWMAELDLRRGGLFAPDVLHGALRIGIGQTMHLPARTYAYGLGTVAGIATFNEGTALAPGVELGVASLPSDRFRFGARWRGERDIAAWARQMQRLDGWARVDLSPRLGVNVIGGRRAGIATYTLGFDWYP